jgi:hypothetical protein
MERGKKIILLLGHGESSKYLYHALKYEFNISAIAIENQSSRLDLVRRRIKKLGFLKVIGQLLFMFIIPPYLRSISKQRINTLKQHYKFEEQAIPEHLIHPLPSVNSVFGLNFLKEQNPDLVLISGTRIISKQILDATSAVFMNIHAGITPAYRGVHGAYWALANNDADRVGVTVHLVDKGIDTGDVLYQKKIGLTSNDNFLTYPLIQLGEGILLLKKAINDFLKDDLHNIKIDKSQSALWYHPTLLFYLKRRILKNIK